MSEFEPENAGVDPNAEEPVVEEKVSQQLIPTGPRFVKFHDGAGKAFLFLVTKEDEGEHLSGAVWSDDDDNNAGLSSGWNPRSQIGRNDDSLEVPGGASWSPFDEA